MFRMLMVVLGRLDSDAHENIAAFFMLLGGLESRLIAFSPRLYAWLELILFGGLDSFAMGLLDKATDDESILCGEIRLYTICPYLWNEFRDQGFRKGYRYVNQEKVDEKDKEEKPYVNLRYITAVNDLPC